MTQKGADAYAARTMRVAEKLETLPPYAADFARRWRAAVELAGRTGPTGNGYLAFEAFLDGIRALLDTQYDTVLGSIRRVDLTSKGKGL